MREVFVVLGASREQVPLIHEAKNKGLVVATFDKNGDAPGLADPAAGYSFNVSSRDVVAIQRALDGASLRPIGVSTMGSDIPDVISKLAAHYGLFGPTPETAELCTNKLKMKRRLQEAGVPVPAFAPVMTTADIQFFVDAHGPSVMKPVDRSGSRGVRRLTEDSDPEIALAITIGQSDTDRAMIERELFGMQISTEAIFWKGECRSIVIAERNYFDPRIDIQRATGGQVMENGGNMPCPLSESALAEVSSVASMSAEALGIHTGVAKGDLIWTSQGCFVLEMAARLGSSELGARTAPAAGAHYLGGAIDIALGNEPTICIEPFSGCVSTRHFFFRPGRVARVGGLEEALELPGVIDCYLNVKVGDIVSPLRSHADRCGSFLVRGASRDEAFRLIEKVYQTVKVETYGRSGHKGTTIKADGLAC